MTTKAKTILFVFMCKLNQLFAFPPIFYQLSLLEQIDFNAWNIRLVPESLKNDLYFMYQVLKIYECKMLMPTAARCMNINRMRKLVCQDVNNRKVASLIVRYDGLALEYLKQFQSDEEVAYFAVKRHVQAMEHVSLSLKDNMDFMRAMLFTGHNLLKYASERLRYDLEFVSYVLKINDKAFQGLPREWQSDLDFVLFALELNPQIFIYLSRKMQSNEEVIKKLATICDEEELEEFLRRVNRSSRR